jgi:hypothetical protein
VLPDTPTLPLRTRLTVASLTPTFAATSASRLLGVRVMLQIYGMKSQESARSDPLDSAILFRTERRACCRFRKSDARNVA